MKGVVLAGGLGTRLLPLTRITNEHLLPVSIVHADDRVRLLGLPTRSGAWTLCLRETVHTEG